MKRYLFILFTGLIITSCQSARTTTGGPTLSYTSLALAQTATPVPPTETPTITPTVPAADVLFRDDFYKGLQPGWQWLNERPANWSLSEFPGYLRMDVVGGYLNLRNASNVLLTPAPADNYFIETSLSFSPRRDNQFAGLVMYETDDNYIQAGISYCTPINDCVGRGLYIDIYQNGNLVPPRNAVKFTEDGLAMRMLRNGNKITFYTSEDGTVWYRLRDFTTTIDVKWVGLITGQSLDKNPAPALFDYFQISVLK